MNSRTDGCFNAARFTPELATHFSHSFFEDPLDRASPSRMKGSNRTVLDVDEDHRQTIRRLNGKQNFRRRRDQAVAAQLTSRKRSKMMNHIGVNLSQRDQGPQPPASRGADFFKKSSPVALHRGARIVSGKSEVEGSAAVWAGESASASRKSVDQPR